jgi:hypothetical protein
MMIECLIQRSGDTCFQKDGIPYAFKKNQHGHSVCNVTSEQHITELLKTTHWYRVYERPADAVVVNEIGHRFIDLDEDDDDTMPEPETADVAGTIEVDAKSELENKLADCRARLSTAHGRQRTPIKAEIAELETKLAQISQEAA